MSSQQQSRTSLTSRSKSQVWALALRLIGGNRTSQRFSSIDRCLGRRHVVGDRLSLGPALHRVGQPGHSRAQEGSLRLTCLLCVGGQGIDIREAATGFPVKHCTSLVDSPCPAGELGTTLDSLQDEGQTRISLSLFVTHRWISDAPLALLSPLKQACQQARQFRGEGGPLRQGVGNLLRQVAFPVRLSLLKVLRC